MEAAGNGAEVWLGEGLVDDVKDDTGHFIVFRVQQDSETQAQACPVTESSFQQTQAQVVMNLAWPWSGELIDVEHRRATLSRHED